MEDLVIMSRIARLTLGSCGRWVADGRPRDEGFEQWVADIGVLTSLEWLTIEIIANNNLKQLPVKGFVHKPCNNSHY